VPSRCCVSLPRRTRQAYLPAHPRFPYALVRYLTQLNGVFLAGTGAQLVAVGLVVADWLRPAAGGGDGGSPGPAPGVLLGGAGAGLQLPGQQAVGELLGGWVPQGLAELVASGAWVAPAMAVLNLVFAFGGAPARICARAEAARGSPASALGGGAVGRV
jgi:hypothetical protein